MRYNDIKSVILEYKREPTARSFGPKIITRVRTSAGHDLGDDLMTAKTIIQLAYDPQSFSHWGIGRKKMQYGGQWISVGVDNAKEVLQQITPSIINSVLEELEHSDPTPNKVFVPWLAREWSNGNIKRFEDIGSRLRPLMQDFIAYKNKKDFPAQAKDIMRLTAHDFETVMTEYQPPEAEQRARGTASTLLDNSEVRVILPEDEEAACYYGRGTRWCTASTRGNNMFNHYNDDGHLYIILPKQPKYEGEKYQLHFDSEQFMDEGDSPIDLADLVLTRFPSLEEFFKKQEPSMASFIMFADDKTLEGLWHLVGEYANDFTNEIYSEWEANDDGFHRWQMEYAEEKGYMTADGDVDWDKVHDDEHFGYDQYNDDAQRMLGDVYEISQWKYFEIREFAQRMDEDGDTEGTPTLTDLDEMFAAAVESEVSNYADLIAEHIHAKIWVRTNFNGAEQYKRDGGRILGKVGEYTVGVVRENRRGTNEAIDRRGFLRGMLGAGAAAAGLTATDAEAAKKKKQQQATQQYNPNVVGSGIRVDPNYKEPADPIVAKAAQKERELAQYRQQTQQAPQQKPTQAQQVATATKSDPRYSANSQLFTARLNQVASALRIDPADLLAVMKFETMGKLTPDVSNRMNAVGLIQFMPSTAKDLGTTTEALKNMSAVEQLEWVYKYYKRQGLRPNSSIFEIYLMTLFPAIAKSKLPDNHVVAADPKSTNPKIAKAAKLPVVHSADISRGYMWRENPAFKVKGKDYYTVADIKNRIKQFASRAQ